MALRRWTSEALFLLVRMFVRLTFHYRRIATSYLRRLCGKRSFVIDQAPGDRSFDNGRYAIFLIWQPNGLPWYVRNALDALAEAEVNVIAVVNHSLAGEMRAELIQASRHVLIRDNTGFDMGGYQDATEFILKNYMVDRLIYLNDSVYFFRKGLAELFGKLASSDADICAPYENWEVHYHVQSFCFSMSRHLLRHRAVEAFWKSYLPVNSRLWTIKKGEVGLSQAAVPNARSFELIYTPGAIRAALGELAKADINQLNTYLPTLIRISESERRYGEVAEQDLIGRLASYSQIHAGGFLYRKLAGNPLIKRDLVWRDQYSIYELEHCFQEVGHEGHLDDILADMRRKGKGSILPIFKRAQFAEGVI